MTREEMISEVGRLLARQRAMARFNLQLPPDQLLLLQRLLYRLGWTKMSRRKYAAYHEGPPPFGHNVEFAPPWPDEEENNEPQGPEEGDYLIYTTGGQHHVHQYGHEVLRFPVHEEPGPRIRAHADTNNFWPNAWMVYDGSHDAIPYCRRTQPRRYAMERTHTEFTDHIAEQPQDLTRSLAFADWLQEQGHEGSARVVREHAQKGAPLVYGTGKENRFDTVVVSNRKEDAGYPTDHKGPFFTSQYYGSNPRGPGREPQKLHLIELHYPTSWGGYVRYYAAVPSDEVQVVTSGMTDVPPPDRPRYSRTNRRTGKVSRFAKADTRHVAHPLIEGFPLEHALRHLANDASAAPELRDTAKHVLTTGDTSGLWGLHDLVQQHENADGTTGHPILKAGYNFMSAADKLHLDGHTRHALSEVANDEKVGVPPQYHADFIYTPEQQAIRAERAMRKGDRRHESLTRADRVVLNRVQNRVRELAPHATPELIDESIRRHAHRAYHIHAMNRPLGEEDSYKNLAIKPPTEGFDKEHTKTIKATRYRRRLLVRYSLESPIEGGSSRCPTCGGTNPVSRTETHTTPCKHCGIEYTSKGTTPKPKSGPPPIPGSNKPKMWLNTETGFPERMRRKPQRYSFNYDEIPGVEGWMSPDGTHYPLRKGHSHGDEVSRHGFPGQYPQDMQKAGWVRVAQEGKHTLWLENFHGRPNSAQIASAVELAARNGLESVVHDAGFKGTRELWSKRDQYSRSRTTVPNDTGMVADNVEREGRWTHGSRVVHYAKVNRSDFLDTLRRLKSSNHSALTNSALDVAKRMGIADTHVLPALHDAPTGSVPGVAQAIYGQVKPEKVHELAAWVNGLLPNSPGYAVFHPRPNGPDTLYRMRHEGSGMDVRVRLDRAGLKSRVLVPHRRGFDVLVPDKGNKLARNVEEYAKAHGISVEASPGHFQSVGSADQGQARSQFRNKVVQGENTRMARKTGKDSRTMKVKRYSGETTEEDFHRILDANPEDHHTRLVFADWLQERGDPRAEGYRALGTHRRSPNTSLAAEGKFLWSHWGTNKDIEHCKSLGSNGCLPHDWERLAPSWYGNRREAEDAAALAFSQLPEERKREILNPPGEPTQPTQMARVSSPRKYGAFDKVQSAPLKEEWLHDFSVPVMFRDGPHVSVVHYAPRRRVTETGNSPWAWEQARYDPALPETKKHLPRKFDSEDSVKSAFPNAMRYGEFLGEHKNRKPGGGYPESGTFLLTPEEVYLATNGKEGTAPSDRGEVDWRPNETIPEDYYAMSRRRRVLCPL